MRDDSDGQDLAALTLALLHARAPDATVCPSEVARASVNAAAIRPDEDQWRGVMPAVHSAVDWLVAEGKVQLRWKGKELTKRAGPYRIARVRAVKAPED
jgi:hypothetical protein